MNAHAPQIGTSRTGPGPRVPSERSVGPLTALVAATPEQRNRAVDLLRAVAIVLVVVGHWLAVVITAQGDQVRGSSALALLAWTHPLSWLFQVMPVFFLVGGYANAASLTAHQRRGGDTGGWLFGRAVRLLRPTAVLLAVLVAVAVLARHLGADPRIVASAVWLALLPAWFLVVYLAVVLLAPVTVRAQRRGGPVALVALVLAVVAVDALRFGAGLPLVGEANYLLAWLAAHQAGVAWRDGVLPQGRSVPGVALLLGGAAAVVLLTVPGPYPVSMVAVPGEPVSNTGPPTAALLALAAAQTGAVLLAAPALDRWLRRSSAWPPVVALNARVMTVYLWHMAAVVPAAGLLLVTGLLPGPPAGSAAWFALRVPWLLVLALLLAVPVLVVGRYERPGGVPVRLGRGRGVAVVAGMLLCCLGLLASALNGADPAAPLGTSTVGLLAVAVGLLAIWSSRRGVPDR
jgi:fucose 4-O-acetylase-like acetyltransferase